MDAQQSYATLDDVYNLGFSARAFVAYARPFEGVDLASGTIRLKAHGFDARDVITFEISGGGQLPSLLSAFALFYPLPIGSDLFQVASTPNGSPLTGFNLAGSAWAVSLDPIRRLNMILVDEAAFIDEHLTAHDPPIARDPVTQKYPPVLVGMNARRTARTAINTFQVDNAQYKVAIDRVLAREQLDNELLKVWLAGKPLQPRPTDQNTTADNAALAQSGTPIDWQSGEL